MGIGAWILMKMDGWRARPHIGAIVLPRQRIHRILAEIPFGGRLFASFGARFNQSCRRATLRVVVGRMSWATLSKPELRRYLSSGFIESHALNGEGVNGSQISRAGNAPGKRVRLSQPLVVREHPAHDMGVAQAPVAWPAGYPAPSAPPPTESAVRACQAEKVDQDEPVSD